MCDGQPSKPHLSAIVHTRCFSLFDHTARMSDKTDAKILTASHWRTEGDHQDGLEWRLYSRTWNPKTSPWMKQLSWLRIVHSGDSEARVCAGSGLIITRSSASHLLSVPRHYLSFGARTFRVAAPKIWNSIPLHIRQSQTYSSFRRHLKTHYFLSAHLAP